MYQETMKSYILWRTDLESLQGIYNFSMRFTLSTQGRYISVWDNTLLHNNVGPTLLATGLSESCIQPQGGLSKDKERL